MSTDLADPQRLTNVPYQIVALNYVSLYIKDFSAAIAFYRQIYSNGLMPAQQRQLITNPLSACT